MINTVDDTKPGDHQSVSSYQRQQQELVSFLYERMTTGVLITLFISTVASVLAYIELSIQGREMWVVGWYAALCCILVLRLYLQRQFSKIREKLYFPYQVWRNRFYFGAVSAGLMQGCGAALLMPMITSNVQIILHSLLLGMGAGAIAFLSTSLRAYTTYLITILMPVTIWLLSQGSIDGLILSFLYLFFMGASAMSVGRMNVLVNEALYYRFDSEMLVDDLQRLLHSVAQSNKALEKISTTDELTGLSNYRSFRVYLEQVWRDSKNQAKPVSAMKINVDCYHEYNLHYGHQKGDATLCEISRMFESELTRKNQMLARLNSAEFVLLLPDCDRDTGRLISQQLARVVDARKIEHATSTVSSFLTMSIGVATLDAIASATSRQLLENVDAALKLATDRGRNRIETLVLKS